MKGPPCSLSSDIAGEAAVETSVDVETAADMAARPEVRLWYRLEASVNLVGEGVRARLREEFQVTPARFELMAHLDTVPEGLSMGELSKRLMVTGGNVTGLATRLVREGLAQRFSSPTDRRTHFLKLSPAGREVFQTMAARHEVWLADILSGLGRDDITQLMVLLGRLKRSVRVAVAQA